MKKAGIVDRMRTAMTDGVLHSSLHQCEHTAFSSRSGSVYFMERDYWLVTYA